MKIVAEPINVIAKFIVKEKPTPIKFQYTTEAGKDVEIKVDQIIEIEEIREIGYKTLVYYCQSKIGGKDRRYELKYVLDKCAWQLFKI